MKDVRYISYDGNPKFAVVPIETWNRICELAATAERTEPQDVRAAIERGDHPLKAWRRHRRMTTRNLADEVGVSRVCITLIETGKRTGSRKTLDAISRVLSIPIQVLAQVPKAAHQPAGQ